MSTRIPDTAKLIDTASGILPSGRWKGQQITMQIYDGYASKGYSSGYERVHHRWVQYAIANGPQGCRSYSGRNLPLATQQLTELKQAIH